MSFDDWYAELRTLAVKEEAEWVVAPLAEAHRSGFSEGLSPEEELQQLLDMAEWRGCGCGGGS